MSTLHNQRIIGIDVVKIVAMLLVVTVYVLGVGGVMDAADNTLLRIIFCIPYGLSYCCINLFALASGFLCYGRKQKLTRLMYLWLQGTFWIIFAVIFVAIYKHDITILKGYYLDCITLITSGQYWYLTKYFILFFFMPALNIFIEKTNLKNTTFIVIGILFITSFISSVSPYNVNLVRGGYSAIWLAVLYLVGAYIKKYDIISKANSTVCAFILAFSTLAQSALLFASKTFGTDTYKYFPRYQDYNSIFVVSISLTLFILLSKVDFKSAKIKKSVTNFSNASLSVYLIHTAPIIFNNFIINKFTFISAYSPIKAVCLSLAVIFGIYISTTLMGMAQNKLFENLHIPNLLIFIENKINICYDLLYERFLKKFADENA